MIFRTLFKSSAASLPMFSVFASLLSGADPADRTFKSLADEYFDQVLFHYQPSTGTYLGLHQYDTQLENFSIASIEAWQRDLHAYEKRIADVPLVRLNSVDRADREMLLNSIRSAILTSEVIQPWKKNPDVYPSSLASSAFTLMERKFAPPAERLRFVIARERWMPANLAAARQNLENPPHVSTDIAIRQIDGTIHFFEKDLPAAFSDVHDATVTTEFKQTNAAVVKALRDYAAWLKTDLLPRSHGDFRIGAKTYSAKLLYDEMVDTPLPKLLDIAYADLRKNQASFERISHEVDASKKPAEVLTELGSDHPPPSQLLKTFSDTFGGLIQFIQTRHIITIPSEIRPALEETPPFMRATTFASMDTPGPFEKKAREAYFNVTLPEKSWGQKRMESFMQTFSFSSIASIAIHEAYPGHYVQLLYSREAPSKIRKIIGANTNIEGWAHYCEQMMMDEGYSQAAAGTNSRRAYLIQLGQLQEALLRDARYIAGIKMHTGQLTMEQAEHLFMNEGYTSEESARIETDRGTSDPTYLYYTLGKLEILKLRADLRKRQGSAFSLEKFHDEFVKQGNPPIRVIRRALLGDDSPPI